MVTRAELHRLIDELPDGALDVAARRLEAFRSPLAQALFSAPPDDEPETDEEREAMAEVYEDLARGTPDISHSELRRLLGL